MNRQKRSHYRIGDEIQLRSQVRSELPVRAGRVVGIRNRYDSAQYLAVRLHDFRYIRVSRREICFKREEQLHG